MIAVLGTNDVRRAALGASVPAVLLLVLLLVPFLGKAFTIDDTLFLREAEHALQDPLHPSGFEIVWSEIPAPVRFSSVQPSGPLMAYLLVPAVLLGGSERIAHLVQLLLFAAALWATAALALRLGGTRALARDAALLLASTPAATAMAGTAMPDVLAMTLGIVGLEALCAFGSEGRLRDGALAALALGLAPTTRSHAAIFVVVGAALLLAAARSGMEVRRTAFMPLAAAPLVALGLLFVTRDVGAGSGSPWSASWLFFSRAAADRNALAFLGHWMLALPVGLVWWMLRGRALPLSIGAWVGLPLVAVLARSGGVLGSGLWIVPVATMGAAVLYDLFADSWRRRDALELALALSALGPLPIVFYVHLPSKYLLVAAPPLSILIARRLAAVPGKRGRAILGVALCLGALLGVLILRADAAFAGIGRRAARELIEPQVRTGRRVWFGGHWGFQWYAERAGGRPLTLTDPLPSRGDLVVTNERLPGFSATGLPDKRLLATLADRAPGGRVMDDRVDAGFYSNGWGYLPWAFSSRELQRFELWELLEAPAPQR